MPTDNPSKSATTRCDYRIERRYDRFPGFDDQVRIYKGKWSIGMDAAVFDCWNDDTFADYMKRVYRETAFDQLEADLAVLADLGRFYLDGPTGSPMYLPPWEKIRDAVERCEAAREVVAS